MLSFVNTETRPSLPLAREVVFLLGFFLFFFTGCTLSSQNYNLQILSNQKFNDIAQNHNELLWLASDFGIFTYDYRVFSRIEFSDKYNGTFVKIIIHNKTPFALSEEGTLYKYNKKENIFHPFVYNITVRKQIDYFFVEFIDNQKIIYITNGKIVIHDLDRNIKEAIYLAQNKTSDESLFDIPALNFVLLGNDIIIRDYNDIFFYNLDKKSLFKSHSLDPNMRIGNVDSSSYYIYNYKINVLSIFDDEKKMLKKILLKDPKTNAEIVRYKSGYLYRDKKTLFYIDDEKDAVPKELELKLNEKKINTRYPFLFIDSQDNIFILSEKLYLTNSHHSFYKVSSIPDESLLRLLATPVLSKDRVFGAVILDEKKYDRYYFSPSENKLFSYTSKIGKRDVYNLNIIYEDNIANYLAQQIYFYWKDDKFQDVDYINNYLKENKTYIHRLQIPGDYIYIFTTQDELLVVNHKTKKINCFELSKNTLYKYYDFKFQKDNELVFLTNHQLIICDYEKQSPPLIYQLSEELKRELKYRTDFYYFNKHLYFTTIDRGFMSSPIDSNKVETIIPSRTKTTGIFKDEKNRFWITSPGKLNVFDYENETVETYPFPEFQFVDFYNKIIYEDQKFYTLTDEYIIEVDTREYLKRPNKNKISVNKIEYIHNNSAKTIIPEKGDLVSLPAGALSITVHLLNSDFLYSKFDYFEYQVNEGVWKKLVGEILLNEYKFDHGLFKIKVRNIKTKKEAFEQTIYIKPFWYQSRLAKFIYSFLFISSMVLIMYAINKKIKEDYRIKSIEESARIRQVFLTKVSHEIRTPINVIIGFSDLLANLNNNKATIKKYSEAIYFAGNNLLHLVNDFLSKTALEENKIFFSSEPFDLKANLKYIEHFFSLKIAEKNLYFNLDIEDEVPANIIGDEKRLTQILVNLIQNAIKFTEKGGVTLKLALVSKTKESVSIQFSVIDTGIGIPLKKQDQVFQSYAQLHEPSKSHEGTGLGLIITKELVEIGGGQIEFESKEKVGTTFFFTLPFKLDNHLEKHLKNEDSPSIKNNKTKMKFSILIAEDDKFNAMLIERLVKMQFENVEMTLAENGLEALNEIKKKTYDVIILDANMPVMGGIEAAKKIREELKLVANNLVCCTASADFHEQEIVHKYFDFLISKPYKKELVYETIISILEKNTPKDAIV